MNDTPDTARIRYIAEYGRFVSAAQAMESHLDNFVRTHGVRAAIEVRAKTVASFVKKIHTRSYQRPWSETTDKVGARVIVKTLVDQECIRAALEDSSEFAVLRVEDMSELADEDRLYYPGVHIQVVVPGVSTSDDEQIECEIQLRTKAQDLWSVPSHQLLYKGVIKPSKATRRRILRLSVLTEMFDEEVRRAMFEVRSDPRYELALLLREAEALYLTFVAEPGEDDLSLEVLATVITALPAVERAEYPTTLRAFVEDRRARLSKLFGDYGVHSPYGAEPAYWLFSQPEALVLFERIDHAPQALSEAVSASEIETAVRPLYAAWGSSMPTIV